MTHADHPDVQTYGLADDCPRCEELAVNPFDLDADALRDLIARTFSNRFGWPSGHVSARSTAEAVAMAQVLTTLERAGRIGDVEPTLLVRYLRERWGLDLS